MPRFTSPFKGLLLEDAKGVWARFEDGVFETDDKAVVARLRKAQDVSEAASDTPAQD